jgi:hypothetical protein
MRPFILYVAVLVGILAMGLLGQQQLNNQAIIQLHNAGLTDETILHMIDSQPGQYSTGVKDVIALKQAGISEKVIRALLNKAVSAPASAAATPSAAGATPVPGAAASPSPSPRASATPAAKPSLTDVFYKKGDGWVAIQPEPVSWKSGGILKSVATVGVKKRDINGTLTGGTSKDKIKSPAEFVLYIPGGVDIREYQLLRLHPHESVREFRAAIGDDFHVSGGRDLVPFDAKAVARRGFLITLKDLSPGEYGWVPPEAALSVHDATAPPGKIYTFAVE